MADWYEVENVSELPSPTLLVFPDRIRSNLESMISWAGAARLRPHVKTHKLPQVIQMKLDLGITKFKTSTIAESEMTAAAGGKDILLALQPVGPNIERLIRLQQTFPGTRFSAIVDEMEIASQIADAAANHSTQVSLFVDLNVGQNRTGILPSTAAAELYRFIASHDLLDAAGLHAYDGHIHDTDQTVVREQMDAAFRSVWQLQKDLQRDGISVPRIVGCGTPTSKIMLERLGSHSASGDLNFEVSAGTSVLWDAGQPTFNPKLDIQTAALLLARVISRPTETDLCVDLGHKAVASEMLPPRVTFLGLEDAQAVAHNEEHLVLRTPEANRYRVGTVLYGIPTHICPTVALHNEAYPIVAGRAEAPWPVVGRTRRISI